jgi:hypothetical protein
MTRKIKHIKGISKENNPYSKKQIALDTAVHETDEDISNYPYCKLPDHYFDLLLHKKQYHSLEPKQLQWHLTA